MCALYTAIGARASAAATARYGAAWTISYALPAQLVWHFDANKEVIL